MSTEQGSPGSSSGRSVLGRVDDALVPVLQRGARGVTRGLGWPARLLARFDRWFLGGRPARAVHEHRTLVAFVVVALAFAGTLVHFQRYPELRQQQTSAGPGGSGDADVAAVGPVTGASVDPYLSERRQALAAAPDDAERLAVASFSDFRTAQAVAEDVGDLTVHEVLHQLPEREPRPQRLAVDGDLVGAVEELLAQRVAELEEEEADVASTLETTDDPDFREDFQARLDELQALRNTLVDDPRIVFAVVVEGRVDRLRALAGRDEVRLVDLAPEGTDVGTTTFHGVLPTAGTRFEHGRTVAG